MQFALVVLRVFFFEKYPKNLNIQLKPCWKPFSALKRQSEFFVRSELSFLLAKFQNCYIHHESFESIIQYCYSKFPPIGEFYLLGGCLSFGYNVRSSNKFLYCKLDICIAKDEKKHA